MRIKTTLQILFNPEKGVFNYENEYTDTLHRQSLVIFALYGLTLIPSSRELFEESYILGILFVFFGISISLFLNMLFSAIISWLILKFKGRAQYEETESIYAHSLIPIILGFLIISFLSNQQGFANIAWYNHETRKAIIFLFLIWSSYVLWSGTKALNGFSWLKSLALLSPFIALTLISFILKYF